MIRVDQFRIKVYFYIGDLYLKSIGIQNLVKYMNVIINKNLFIFNEICFIIHLKFIY